MSNAVIVIALALGFLLIVVLLVRGRGKRAGQLQGPQISAPVPPTSTPKASEKTASKSARPGPPAEAAKPAAKKPPPRIPDEASRKKETPPPPPAAETSARKAPRAEEEKEAPKTPSSVPPVPAKKDIAGLRKGLAATRGGFVARLASLFQGKREIDPAILEQMEEVMLASDVGPKTTQAILGRLRDSLGRNELRDGDAVWAALRSEASRILSVGGGGPIRTGTKPTIVLVVGVNGVGKTTTIGKLATRFHGGGKKVLLAAGDTFRAAAVQQLEVWGKRVGAEVVRGKEGADPGAVAFDAVGKAQADSADLLLVDTAGRLHTKAPLMDEIKKVRKTIAKALDGAPHETLLVLDATTGQNALQQAALFKDALDLTGIVLTKLDGTAKGGIVLGVCDELGVPVRYVGLGERAEDLREFHAEEFVEALFGKGEEEVAAA